MIAPVGLLGQFTIWLTPLWLIAAGVVLGLVVLLAGYGVFRLAWPRAAAWVSAAVTEGVLQPIFFLAMLLAGLGLMTAYSMPLGNFWKSFARWSEVGPGQVEIVVAEDTTAHPVEVSFEPGELKSLRIASDQDIFLATEPGSISEVYATRIEADDPMSWNNQSTSAYNFRGRLETLYLTNEGAQPATVLIDWQTAAIYPEVVLILQTAAALVGLFLLYFAMRLTMPKISVIAAATAKEAMVQPIYLLALVLGVVALIAFIYIPYNTFGEDIKMLKDSGLTMIMVLAIVVALWTASVSVAEEIDGRTALTVLSKPIGRRQFILGKFFGILWPILLMFVILGLVFLATVCFKVVYDARETAKSEIVWQECYVEMIRIIPGLVLAFLETVMLAAISVAISTRLPMLPNLLICASIYVLGHLGPMIVNSGAGQIPIVRFVGQFIAIVLPVLDQMNIQPAIAAGRQVPLDYLGWAALYCVLYSTAAMLLALVLFEDRDLA